MIDKIIRGGFLRDRRTHIVSAVFAMLQAVFTLGGVYFLHKTNKTKGKKYGQDS